MTSHPAVPPIFAVLFDIDGTLVDSNYLHIAAWMRAFSDLEIPIDAWRVHRGLGKDSEQLLGELLGDGADELGPRAAARHTKHYRKSAKRLRPFEGARELLGELRDRGITVVLATSAPSDELEILLDVLEVDASSVVVTNADDVDTAKPDPSIVRIALERAGVDADHAVFVGDSVWDIQAARTAGVRTVGVRSGGIGADELRAAGADDVVTDVDELRRRGHQWPEGPEPKGLARSLS